MLALFLGILLSVLSSSVINDSIIQAMPGRKCLDCGMVGISYMITGFLITIISATTIGAFCGAIYYFNKKQIHRWSKSAETN